MNNSLNQALPIIASALGDEMGVEVLVQGSQAYTDGNKIVIPAIEPNDPNRKNVVMGYLTHEAGHKAFTDFDIAQSLPNDVTFHIWNIFEDVWMEKAQVSRFPGTRQYLFDTLKYLCDKGRMNVPDENASPGEVLTSHLLFRLRLRVLGQNILQDRATRTEEIFRDQFPKGVPTRLHGLISEVSTMSSTKEAANLAVRIRSMIEEEQKKEEQQQQEQGNSDQSSGSGQDNQDDGQGDRSGSNPDSQTDDQSDDNQSCGSGQDDQSDDDQDNDGQDDSTASSGAGDQSDDDQSDGSGQSNGDQDDQSGQSTSTSQGKGSGSVKEYAQVLKDALSGEGISNKDLGDMISDVISDDVAQHPEEMMDVDYIPRPVEGLSVESRGAAHFNRGQIVSSGLRSRLEGLIQAQRTTTRRVSRKGKKIATRRICRVISGDSRIFAHKTKHDAPNTAFHLLVDCSGSMNGNPLVVALESTLALLQSLEGIDGVDTSASAFPYKDEDGNQAVELLKKSGETTRFASKRFGINARGTTPMGEAMYGAGVELAKTNCDRKIMFVLTDGAPNHNGSVYSAISDLDRAGIELIAIGIGTDTVRQFFKNNVVIKDTSDLLTTMFQLTRQMLAA